MSSRRPSPLRGPIPHGNKISSCKFLLLFLLFSHFLFLFLNYNRLLRRNSLDSTRGTRTACRVGRALHCLSIQYHIISSRNGPTMRTRKGKKRNKKMRFFFLLCWSIFLIVCLLGNVRLQCGDGDGDGGRSRPNKSIEHHYTIADAAVIHSPALSSYRSLLLLGLGGFSFSLFKLSAAFTFKAAYCKSRVKRKMDDDVRRRASCLVYR